VVDHQLDGHQRVDARRVAVQVVHRVAHGGEVDDRGHAGEVLHQHARGRVGDLARRLVGGDPRREVLDVLRLDGLAVLAPEQVLEQDLQRVRKPGDVELRLERVEPEDLVGIRAHGELGSRSEAVRMCHGFNPIEGLAFTPCTTWPA
jgi:hypothetical protein